MAHETQLKVRTYECDEYGHVNNAIYLNYLEHARVEFLDAVHFPYRELRLKGFGVVVTEISIKYHRELIPGDLILIHTVPEKIENFSGIFKQTITRNSELIAEAKVKWAFLDAQGRPCRLLEEHKKALQIEQQTGNA